MQRTFGAKILAPFVQSAAPKWHVTQHGDVKMEGKNLYTNEKTRMIAHNMCLQRSHLQPSEQNEPFSTDMKFKPERKDIQPCFFICLVFWLMLTQSLYEDCFLLYCKFRFFLTNEMCCSRVLRIISFGGFSLANEAPSIHQRYILPLVTIPLTALIAANPSVKAEPFLSSAARK